MRKSVFCATGHRPSKLGGYSQCVKKKLFEIALSRISEFVNEDETVISGMAQGWDQAVALAAITLNRRLLAAIPFRGQELCWPEEAQAIYKDILSKASTIHYVSEGGYSAAKMQKRNEWMIDNSDVVLSLYDGTPGGTANCLAYADKKGIREIECWSLWNAWELL